MGGGVSSFPPPVSMCLNAGGMGRRDAETETLIPTLGGGFDEAPDIQCVTGSVTHTLKAEGFDASEDGTGRGQPIVPLIYQDSEFGVQEYDTAGTLRAGRIPEHQMILEPTAYRTSGNCGAWETGDRVDALTTGTDPFSHIIGFSAKDHGGDATAELDSTLRAGGHSDSHANGGVMPAVAYAFKPGMSEAAGGLMVTEEFSPTLQASENGSTRTPAVAYSPIPFDTTQLTSPLNYSNPQPGDPCHPLAAGAHAPAICGREMAVRRLMPVECERLQGFPDNWTRIPVRFYARRRVTKTRPDDMWERGIGPNGSKGWWLMAADGPRYKQLGNSMARNVMFWLGNRIRNWVQLEPFRELIG
jgi:DNA (cytosine-5)-methyltransferase 1